MAQQYRVRVADAPSHSKVDIPFCNLYKNGQKVSNPRGIWSKKVDGGALVTIEDGESWEIECGGKFNRGSGSTSRKELATERIPFAPGIHRLVKGQSQDFTVEIVALA